MATLMVTEVSFDTRREGGDKGWGIAKKDPTHEHKYKTLEDGRVITILVPLRVGYGPSRR